MKEELQYAIKLAKLKALYFKKNFMAIAIVWGAVNILELITVLVLVQKSKENELTTLSDFFIWITFFVLINAFVRNVSMDDRNRTQNVYPGTNISRCIAFMIFNDGFMIICFTAILLQHFVTEGIVYLVCRMDTSIVKASEFNVGYELYSYVAIVLLSVLFINGLNLITCFIRRFRYVGILIVIACIVLTAIYIEGLPRTAMNITAIFGITQNAVLFISLMVFINVIVIALTIFIAGRVKVDYVFTSKNSRIYDMLYLVCNSLLLIIGFLAIILICDDASSFRKERMSNKNYENMIDERYNLGNTTNIDYSKVDEKKLNIVFKNFENLQNMSVELRGDDDFYTCNYKNSVRDKEFLKRMISQLERSKNKKLEINYSMPYYERDNVVISDYSKSYIDAELKEDTLYLTYHEDNPKLLLINTWPIVSYVDSFDDIKVTCNSFSSSSGGGNGTLMMEFN